MAHENSHKTRLFVLKAKAKASTQLGTVARFGMYQHPTAGRKIKATGKLNEDFQ
jgi:hypothetical protein